MLNWKKIYELNDENNKKAGTYFEQLALEYLSSVYSQYSWKTTKSSWDGNKDFVSLILDNIWGEAKYKKDSSALRRQDVDPTMISGFLDEKIKLVFIITNGTIPQTINNRINETAKRCGFTIVGITQTQLEYWLITHPNRYAAFFKEQLPSVCLPKAVSIEDVRLENHLDSHFESSYIEPEFIENNIYQLCVTFSCNAKVNCFIKEDLDYPFEFLEPPQIQLLPGFQQKYFAIKLTRENSIPIVLEFVQENNSILISILDIKIVSDRNPKLVYSKQEYTKIDICNTIDRLPEGDFNHIIAIQGKEGYGKTFVMREMAKDLSFNFPVAVLQCATSDSSSINCMKLCQAIMYLNYGDLYQKNEEYSNEARNYYKYWLKKNNHENIILDELLLDIFEGCFDPMIAHSVINNLSRESTKTIMKKTRFARRHILFMDDIHLLSSEEDIVFRMILSQFKNSYNNSVLIFSCEKDIYDVGSFYILKGLESGDIIESLKGNLSKIQYRPFISMVKKMPCKPQMISELISFIKHNSIKDLPSGNMNEYIIQVYNNRHTNLQFNLTDNEKTVMELIFSFQNGIHEKLLTIINVDEKLLANLCEKGYISYYKQRYIRCYDYFYYSYKNQSRNSSINENLVFYLCELLDNAYEDPLFDTIQAQKLLLQYNPELYLQKKATFKDMVIEYISKGFYREAMLYGELFCFDILNDKSQGNEIDMDVLFYYGISLIHCDSHRRAIEIFTYIKNHANRNSLLFFRASAELFNNKYSRFQIENILPEVIVLKYDIQASMKQCVDENSLDTHNLRISYSTCMNRMMMIYFLLDDYENATKTYKEFCEYHSTIPDCIYSDKYDSMLLEWKMDYARGAVLYQLDNSVRLDIDCCNEFSEKIDFRRTVLCKIDKTFFEAVIYKNYDDAINKIINYQQKLRAKGIVSEDMKATIRIAYCRLMKYASIPEFSDISSLEPFAEEIYSEMFSAQLEALLIVQGRAAYILNNILAILHIIKGEINSATEILEYNIKLIQKCGSEYRRITQHNLQNINFIKKIDWYFSKNAMSVDTYYLDIRVW